MTEELNSLGREGKERGAMAGLELENLKLQRRVAELEEALKEMNEALKESTKLLTRTKPTRPPIPHERKLLVAAAQKWKCANPFGTCLLYKLGDGVFNEALFEADHIYPYSPFDRWQILPACALCAIIQKAATNGYKLSSLNRTRQPRPRPKGKA